MYVRTYLCCMYVYSYVCMYQFINLFQLLLLLLLLLLLFLISDVILKDHEAGNFAFLLKVYHTSLPMYEFSSTDSSIIVINSFTFLHNSFFFLSSCSVPSMITMIIPLHTILS